MKFSKLLVLGALGLVSLSVNAVELIDREAPFAPDFVEPEVASIDLTAPVEFEVGKAYVLYNTGSNMFYYRGNAWTTQASGSAEHALIVRFVMPSGMTMADKALYLRDFDDRSDQMKWRTAFITTTDSKACTELGLPGALFVDNNDGGAAYMWVEAVGNKTYHLSVSEKNTAIQPEGRFFAVTDLSYDGDGMGGNAISPVAEDGNIEWQFFPVADWTDYFVQLDVYNKAEELKTFINMAETNGIDVTAAAAVYNNPDATLEQIEAAMKALQQALAGGIGSGTAENPTDATSVIVNPDFDNASAAGWLGSSPNMVGSGSHGPANVAEFYQGSNINMYQELNGIPAGVYRLTMYGMYRSGDHNVAYQNFLDNANYRAKLYATVDGEMLTTDIVNPYEIQNKTSYAGATEWGTTAAESNSNGFYIPNDPSCARVYFDQGWYKNTLFFYVSADNATIGVREDGSYLSNDWFPFDEFRLTYFGNTQESFGKWVELSAPDFTGMNITVSLRENFESTLQDLVGSASDKASAVAAVEQLKPLIDEIKANAALWAKYIAKMDEAMALASTGEYEEYGSDIADYHMLDYEEIIGSLELTSEEIEAEMAKIDELVAAMKEAAANDIKEGSHVTNSWFTNCDFANGNTGWTISKGSCNFRVGIAEAYGVEFDIHQDAAMPAKKGVYQLDLQGFFRTARNNESLATYLDGTQKCDAGVYLGTADATNKTYVKCVFAEQIADEDRGNASGFNPDSGDWSDGNYYANTMEAANVAFQAGMYKNTAYGIVKNEGEILRIGVGGKLGGSDWICWDNFDLIFLGDNDPTANAYLIDLAIEDLDNMDLTKPMGKSVKSEVEAAIAAANTAKAGSDGAAMFDALSDLYDVKAKVEASQALFAELNKLAEDVMAAALAPDVDQTVGDATAAIVEEIQNGMMAGEYEDADVPALKARLQAALTALYLPADMAQATDANSVDATKVIQSADYGEKKYDEDGNEMLGNSTVGWEGTAGNTGNDDTQKMAHAYEFYEIAFDHYQTLYGMPAGIYEVSVYAFNRFGGHGEDLKAFREGTLNTAYLYAEAGGQQNRVALPFLAACEGADGLGLDGEVTVNIDGEGNETSDESLAVETFYRPNTLAAAKGYMEAYEDIFLNKVVAKVGDDGILKIGINRPEKQTYGWSVMDTWQLKYYGAASTKTPTGDRWTQGIDETVKSTASKVEFFTLDGRKATAAQKGVVIVRQTMSDGKVIVRKVRK